jgi:glycosyltransferase involved in cell wall biosynthesis
LCTRVNGTDELISEGKNGFFIHRNGKSIASILDKIISDGNIDSLGGMSRKVAEEYSWDCVVEKTLAVINSL